ncbi:MEDS: MEthanogen/methylotroph, DcmR Sensory domain [Mesobacillus persicus]|uniref:MEDS: MEthanogen/methylotroph, DcmR Sensory domain n=1 Tax=Mesobacillus persicus TaxID=930146 RepID=A0A1H8IRF6_9BACI|nr:MEDS domain-containing protein [Mesobacillus persicus]SEN70685.1 MEDS: MEthanogen/methylotroph, DcmR Sensory domain [Mesobacillus persicus]
MNKISGQLANPLQEPICNHILYCFEKLDCYIENVVTFILTEVEQGNFIILIENERIFQLIKKKLNSQISEEGQKLINYVNNFDFYFSHGDFHTPTIISTFTDLLEPYRKRGGTICTWAHVEWGNDDEITCKIKEFEEVANQTVSSMNTTSVCAYDADRLSESLKKDLNSSHPCQLTDTDFFVKATK